VIVRHTDAAHDHEVAELAPSLTVPQLARILPSLPRAERDTPADDQPPGNDGDTRPTRRGVRFGYGDDGMWWCSIRLPSDEGALVQKGLEVGRDREFRLRNLSRNDGDRGDPGDVCWADALLRLAQSGLDGLDPSTAAGRPPGERTQVILHLDADRQAPPRLHLGPVLPPGMADYLSCDSTVRYLLTRNGQPVAMGRRQHTVKPPPADQHRTPRWRLPGSRLRPGSLATHPPHRALDPGGQNRPRQPPRPVHPPPPHGAPRAPQHPRRPRSRRRAHVDRQLRSATRAGPAATTSFRSVERRGRR
jgi:hypothetical protein